MAPFLRDEGPPVSKDTIQRARESLPLEFGYQVVNETGRECLIIRVPKAKPDYLHDLGDAAFYIGLDVIRNCKDILLIGHEKTARVEPQLLRDNIRAQDREDADLVSDIRRRLGRDYGQTNIQSPSNFAHQALVVRIPKGSITDFAPEDVKTIRELVQAQGANFQKYQYAYIVADRDHERLGRRMLLELLGQPAQAPANQQPLAPALPPASNVPIAQRVALPMTPGTATIAAPPQTANVQTGALPAFLSSKTHSNASVAPVLQPTPVLASPSPVAPAPAPEPAPMAPLEVDDHEEYAIISRPKAAAPAVPQAPAQPLAPAAPAADITVEPEYEITSKPKAVEAAPEAAPMVEDHPDVERKVSASTEAYEVYTSKPKTPKVQGPSITPPGQGGFQHALDAATSTGGHAAPKTKEYEIMGGARPSAAPISSPVARMLQKPVDDPRAVAQLPARPAFTVPASSENGAAIIPTVQAVAPEQLLAQRFRDHGYEIVESLRAQGTVFAFAAHKQNGRRVLLKRAAEFGPDDAAQLAQLVAALGADICLVVADKVAPGTRLATWGTRIEALVVGEAAALTF